jgi:hypothetical protein
MQKFARMSAFFLISASVFAAVTYLVYRGPRQRNDFLANLDFRPPSTVLYNRPGSHVWDLAASADGQVLAFCTSLGEVFLSQAPFETYVLIDSNGRSVKKLTMSADGKWLAYCTDISELVVIDLEKRTHLGECDLSKSVAPGRVTALLFRRNGDGLLASTSFPDGLVIAVDRTCAKSQVVFRSRDVATVPTTSINGISAMALVSEGQKVVIGMHTGMLMLDMTTFRQDWNLSGTEHLADQIAPAGKDRFLSGYPGARCKVLDCERGRVLREFQVGSKSLDVNERWSFLASVGVDGVHDPQWITLVDLQSGEKLVTWGVNEQISALKLLDEGHIVAISSYSGCVFIWREIPELHARKPSP